MYFSEETLRELRGIAKYWRDDPLWKMNGAGASNEGDLFVHHDKYLHGDDGKYHEDFCRFVNSLSGFSQSGFVFFYHRGPEPQKGSRTIDLNKDRGKPSFRSTPVQEKTNTFLLDYKVF